MVLAADQRDTPRLVAGDQVEVPLPIARLDVGEAVPFLREGTQRLGKQRAVVGLHRRLAGPGAHQRAPRTEPVADVQIVEQLVRLRRHVLAQHHLNPAVGVLQVEERSATHATHSDDAAGDRDGAGPSIAGALLFLGLEVRDRLGRRVRAVVLVRVGVYAATAQTVELFAAYAVELVSRLSHGGKSFEGTG